MTLPKKVVLTLLYCGFALGTWMMWLGLTHRFVRVEYKSGDVPPARPVIEPTCGDERPWMWWSVHKTTYRTLVPTSKQHAELARLFYGINPGSVVLKLDVKVHHRWNRESTISVRVMRWDNDVGDPDQGVEVEPITLKRFSRQMVDVDLTPALIRLMNNGWWKPGEDLVLECRAKKSDAKTEKYVCCVVDAKLVITIHEAWK